MNTGKKGGGRDVIVSLVEAAQTITGNGTTTLEDGKWYIATEKAATGSGVDDFLPGRPFKGSDDITPAVGDTVIELTDFWEKKHIVGFANSKSLTLSKSSFDVTTDWDEYYAKQTEEQVEITGSFDGYKINGIVDEETSIVKLNRQFTDIVIQTAEGNQTLERTNEDLYFAFIYQKTAPKTGDTVDITFTPAVVTSNAESSQYSSGNTQNISFEGTSYSEFGAMPSKAVVVY